jgi:ribonucleoside-diphosphate reductase alpha chain
MKVKKRDGSLEEMRYDKITRRINIFCGDLNMKFIDPTYVTLKVTQGIYDGISTAELDVLAAETAASMVTTHPDYAKLAGRLAVSNLHKTTPKKFSQAIKELYSFNEPKTGIESSLISDEVYKFVMDNKDVFDGAINQDRDLNFDYFGFKTLERSYLLKIGKRVVERPQYMYMRVAVGICKGDVGMALRIYDDLSQHFYTHATPTLFNAGTKRPQMSSCFLIANKGDDIDGLFDTIGDVAKISKWAGGIGLHVHDVRAKGAYIKGTGGESDGLVPMMKTYNEVARWINQCFAPETLLYTNNGVKRIDEIQIGDLVLTKDKNYAEIGEVFSYHQNGGMIEIETKSTLKPLRLTDSHPLFGFKNTYNRIGRQNSEYLNQLEKGIIIPDWIDSGEYKVGDFVGKPIPKEIIDVVDFTDEDAFVYGLLLGDGHISHKEVGLSFNQITNQEEVSFVIKYLNDRNINFWQFNRDNSPYLQIRFSLSKLNWLNQDLLYNNKGEKRIHIKYTHLPLNKSIQIIRGLLKSDGGIYRKNEIHFYNTSEELIENLTYQVLRFGIPTYGSWQYRENNSDYLIEHGCKKEKTFSCDLRIPAFDKLAEVLNVEPIVKKNWIVWDNIIYTRITSVKMLEDYSGKVYDLKIKESSEDPSYTLTSCLVHNGGKRKGSFAVYLEPWHSDIFEFIDLRKNHGKEEMRARDLFLAMWTPNLFMKRVEEDGDWSLFSPDEAPGLSDVHDDPTKFTQDFTELYEKYEKEGRARKVIKARKLMDAIITAQIETGTPYMLYKDAANYKSNQKNLGTIKSSNLCTEIIEYSSPTEQAVCNLASIALPKYIIDGEFNHQLLFEYTYQVVKNLNNVIDLNFYPTEETKRSNFRHRPVGLGVQGLADVFCLLNLPFESETADKLQVDIFETIYFAAITSSKDLAKEFGPYETIGGSPIESGVFQYHMWGKKKEDLSGKWDWKSLRDEVIKYGVRNSLLVAPMPTASTAQILGNNEAFEPFTTNLYSRRTLGGEFIVVNKHLVNELLKHDLWNESIKNKIILENGSIQNIPEIPTEIKEVYKTVWEMSQKRILQMAANRSIFIDQSQSLNLFIDNATKPKLLAAHIHGWKLGLKTGMYYLRTRAAVDPIKTLGVDISIIKPVENVQPPVSKNQYISEETPEVIMTSEKPTDSPFECEGCGS